MILSQRWAAKPNSTGAFTRFMLLPRLQVSCVFLLLGHNFLGDLFGRLSAGGRSILAELPNKKCIHALRVNGSHQALKKVQYTGRILSLSLCLRGV
jgi:hypothetical protein